MWQRIKLSTGANSGDEEEERNLRLKSLIVLVIAWDLFIVVFGMLFAPPFKGADSIIGLPDSTMRLFYLGESMFFHALSIPFVAMLSYIALAIFDTRGRTSTLVRISATGSFSLASSSAMYTVLSGSNPVSIAVFWSGLMLSVVSGVGLAIVLWPKKDDRAHMKLKGRSLVALTVWMSLICVLAAVLVGVYVSTGSAQWGAMSAFKGFRLARALHVHVVITSIDVALVALIARYFGADGYLGTPGLFVKIGLCGLLFGIPTTTVATFVTVPLGVAAHDAITAFAAILLQASLFIMYAIMAVEGRNLGIGNAKGVLKNIMTFGLLFIIFWVNVVVTLPGIYVAVNLKSFRGQPNELAFITGHEHILITLTAVAALMLVAHMYRVKGILGIIGGSGLTAGYVLSSAATVPYMFLDWNTVGSAYMPYIRAGIALMVVGTLTVLVSLAKQWELAAD